MRSGTALRSRSWRAAAGRYRRLVSREPERVVALAGDWHGNGAWATDRIRNVAARGVRTVLHVGDFGVWPGKHGARFLRAVESVCADTGVEVLVTPGNHEDWGRLDALWANPKRRGEDGRPLQERLSEHVTVLPRGHRFTLHGRTFLSFGGAASIDYEQRTENRDWWPTEMSTQADVDAAVAGGPVDVLLSHDSADRPNVVPMVAFTLASNPMGWSLAALSYSATSRARVNQVLEAVQPRLMVHGHHHLAGQTTVRLPGAVHDTGIWALACDGKAGNLRLLDLRTLTDPDRRALPVRQHGR